MKILHIKVQGLPLFKEIFEVSFFASQRIENTHMDALFNLFGNIYINTAEAFIGINASGKTSSLKVLSFASYLLSAVPLNLFNSAGLLGDDNVAVFDIDFYLDGNIYRLSSEVTRQRQNDGKFKTIILDEKIWKKPVNSKINKSNLIDFDGVKPERIRGNDDEYLSDDVSIMIAINKQLKEMTEFVDLGMFTDFNLLIHPEGRVPTEIITLLDSTIESFYVERVNDKDIARLKFFGRDEITIYNLADINLYLSSGTVKGVRVFSDAIRVLMNGGYLVVDEIENHFNRELVVSLLRLFMNRKTNPNGGVVIFSTHYPELLDELERNDSVFITRNNHGLSVDNLNSLLKRNDIKKSEVYQSNFLGGTAPKYTALMNLQKSIESELVKR